MKNYLFLISYLFVCLGSLKAQNPVAAFSASKLAGCAPLAVTFTDESTGNPTFWNWDFGNGDLSTVQNPTVTFSQPGTYTITLVARNSTGTDGITKTDYITVYPSPAAAFIADRTVACLPATIQFTDQSTSSSGTINSWSWNFGDGTAGVTNQSPSHSYTGAGFYTVSLTVTSTSGCSSTAAIGRYIRIVSGVTAGFDYTTNASCTAPFTANFTNQTSGPGNLSYIWRFNDGTTLTTDNATHGYPAPGNYDVKLVASSDLGCADSIVKTVAINGADVQFTVPAGACINVPASFQNTSSAGATSFSWDFGDGSTSTAQNPNHAYATPGTYTVSLTGTYPFCSNTVTNTIVVTGADFDFTADKTTACATPLTVNFTNSSPAISGWQWDFGDGGTSNVQSPSHIYTNPGSYTVTLTIPGSGGCSKTVTKNNYINIVAPSIKYTPIKECINYSYSPIANGNVIVTAVDGVASWNWDFGDPASGANNTSTSPSPTHSYNTIGIYNVTLTITTNGGCTITQTFTSAVTISNHVNPNFTFTPTSICTLQPVQFTNTSVPAGDSWQWNFGDGAASILPNPTHTYVHALNYNVTLQVGNNGCYTPVNKFLTVLPPDADFTISVPNCTKPFTIHFTSTSAIGASPNYNWQIGGQTFASTANADYTFNAAGTYQVTLTVGDANGCSSTITKDVIVAGQNTAPNPGFTVSDSVSVCQLFQTNFTFQGTNYSSYSWDFGDGSTSTLQNPTHFYNSYGNYIAKLYVTGPGGCVDSAQHTIQVVQPNSSMLSYSPTTMCNEITVDFTLMPPPSTSFTFYFGDGKSDNTQATTLQHYYGTPSTYGPALVITDQGGCIASTGGATPIRVIGAEPFYSQDRKAFCDNGPVTFTNFIIGNDPVTSYIWDFGDGNTSSTDTNPVHTYTNPGTYITSLTVNTQHPCTKTLYDTVRVYRTPAPSIASKDIVCVNDTIVFDGSLAVADTSITWNWDLGNGKTSTVHNTSDVYNTAGNYTINFKATNLLGCSGSASKSITVAPTPVVTVANNPVIAVGGSVTLPVSYTNIINTYVWTPPNGLSCTDCATPVATPKSTTTYKVAVTDANGCMASNNVTVTVVCNEENYFIPNTFSPNGDGMNDVFYPRGKGLYTVRSMRIFSRWGEMVYEKTNFFSNDPSAGWNGSYKGKPAGKDVYVYMIEVVCENSQIVLLKGNVTLLR